MSSRRRHGGAGLRRGIRATTGVPVLLPSLIFGASLYLSYIMRDPWLVYSGMDVVGVLESRGAGPNLAPLHGAPSYSAGGLDGQDAVQFDASATENLNTSSISIAAGVLLDVYCVIQHTGTLPPVTAADSWRMAGDQHKLQLVTPSNEWRFTFGTVSGGFKSALHPTIASGVPRLMGHTMYGDNCTAWVDGVSSVAFAGPTGGQLVSPINQLTLGGITTGRYWNGRMSELVVAVNVPDGNAARLAYQERVKALYPTIGASVA